MVKTEAVKLLVAFLSVRKLIAMFLTSAFCYLALKGQVSSSEFVTVFTMVIGFYFGRSTALDVPGEKQKQQEGG
jgi:hypothetical protein